MKHDRSVVWDLRNEGQAERFRQLVEALISSGAQVTSLEYRHPARPGKAPPEADQDAGG